MYGSYAALIKVTERLLQERKLPTQPKFLFPVISSLGFMNADMTQHSWWKCSNSRAGDEPESGFRTPALGGPRTSNSGRGGFVDSGRTLQSSSLKEKKKFA